MEKRHFQKYIQFKNILGIKKERPRIKKGFGWKRTEIKMGGQGWCSISADKNKILMITI